MKGTIEAIHAKCIEDGDCWIWQGAMSHGSRPVARLEGSRKNVSVRRLVLELRGVHPGKRMAYPKCANQACVCPDHVQAMSRAKMHTLIAASTGYASTPERRAKIAAAKRKLSPITPELVEEIRTSPESGHAIARRLGFCQATVQAIRAHESWRDYQNPYLQLVA